MFMFVIISSLYQFHIIAMATCIILVCREMWKEEEKVIGY